MARTVKQDLLTRCFTLFQPSRFGDLKAVELHCHFREDLVKNGKTPRSIKFADSPNEIWGRRGSNATVPLTIGLTQGRIPLPLLVSERCLKRSARGCHGPALPSQPSPVLRRPGRHRRPPSGPCGR